MHRIIRTLFIWQRRIRSIFNTSLCTAHCINSQLATVYEVELVSLVREMTLCSNRNYKPTPKDGKQNHISSPMQKSQFKIQRNFSAFLLFSSPLHVWSMTAVTQFVVHAELYTLPVLRPLPPQMTDAMQANRLIINKLLHILPVYVTWMGWSNCCFQCHSRSSSNIFKILSWNSLCSCCFSDKYGTCFSCCNGSVACWGITLILVINALAHLTLRFLDHRSRLKTSNWALTLWSIKFIWIIFKIQFVPNQKTQHALITKINQLMLYREIICFFWKIIQNAE